MLRRLLPPAELRLIQAEMDELHARLRERVGVREADRRISRQWRQYPWLVLAAKLRPPGGPVRPRRVSDIQAGPWLTPQGVRQSARSLANSPLLTGAIVLTVGLGIAGCTTIFSLVDALYLRPLPYPDVDRLVAIHTDAPPNRFPFSVADFQALEEQQTSFDAVAAYGRNRRTLLTEGTAELIPTLEGTPALLHVWGVRPLQGRLPEAADGLPDASPTVLVTVGFAQRYMDGGSDGSGAVGKTVNLDGEAYEVLGVLPASLGPLARNTELVPTLRLRPPSRKGPFFLRPFGRLRPGVAPEAAGAELRAINDRIFPVWASSYQDRNATWGLQPVAVAVRGDVGRLVAVLMAAVGMVLLIALANASNLLVARVGSRSRELAVRSALGASRGRIWGHLLVESLLLAGGGVAVGLAAARLGVAVLPTMASSYLSRADEAALSPTVVMFALGLSALSGLLFSVIPALHHLRADRPADELRAGGRSATTGKARQRTQRLLVTAQVALVVPLLAGAFLLLQSFVNLGRADAGFDVSRLVSMRVSLSPATHGDAVALRHFWDGALERIEALPGVERAALSSERPPSNVENVNNFDLEDRPTAPGEPIRLAAWVSAGAEYFDVMGIPLVEGRGFTPTDLDPDAPQVVLVDETWVRRNYPGESAVGRRFYEGGQTSGPRATVVGVVGSVPYQGVGGSDLGAMYAPTDNSLGAPFLMIRAAGDPQTVTAAVREELRRLDPTAPVTLVATGDALLDDALAQPRHLSLLVGLFSLVALTLSVVGIYGVTAFAMQQRRGDIAVRMALGGNPRSVLRMTVWGGMQVTLMGLAVGAVMGLGMTRILGGLLYQVGPADPRALAAAGGLLLTVAAAATLIPALRAVRVDPARVLREE